MTKWYVLSGIILILWVGALLLLNRAQPVPEAQYEWLKTKQIPLPDTHDESSTASAEKPWMTMAGISNKSNPALDSLKSNPPAIDLAHHKPGLRVGWKNDFRRLIAELRTIKQNPDAYPSDYPDKAIELLNKYRELFAANGDLSLHGLNTRAKAIIQAHQTQNEELFWQGMVFLTTYFDGSAIPDSF